MTESDPTILTNVTSLWPRPTLNLVCPDGASLVDDIAPESPQVYNKATLTRRGSRTARRIQPRLVRLMLKYNVETYSSEYLLICYSRRAQKLREAR